MTNIKIVNGRYFISSRENQLREDSFKLKKIENDEKYYKYMRECSADDIGNVNRFLHIFGSKVKYNINSNKWHIWNGKQWREDNSYFINKLAATVMTTYRKAMKGHSDDHDPKMKLLCSHSRHSCNERQINALISMLKAYTNVTSDKFDNIKHYLNVNNGVVDLRTGELLPHKKSYMCSKLVSVDYNPEAESKYFINYIKSVFKNDNELIDYISRVFGYSITGEVREQCAFFLYGSGSNGKSTFIDAIDYVLSDYVSHVPIQLFLEKNSMKSSGRATPELAQIVSKRIIFASELNEGDYLNEGMFKLLCGGSKINARCLYGQPFEYEPMFTSLIDTNYLPKVKGRDNAIWRRIKVIPFDVTFSGKDRDKNLLDKLRSDKEAILAWLVEGSVKYYKDGLKTPKRVKKATKEYKSNEDILQNFLDQCTEESDNGSVEARKLYESFADFCLSNGFECLTQTMFGRVLQYKGIEKARTSSGIIYNGISLK